MLPSGATYEEVLERFIWRIPEFYNIGVDVCDKWAADDPERLALLAVEENGATEVVTFGALRDRSNAAANLLEACDVSSGDRVGILLPQSPETAYAHIAAFKMGAISIPLFTLFGGEALQHRLHVGERGVRDVQQTAGFLNVLNALLQAADAGLNRLGDGEAGGVVRSRIHA